MMIDCSHKFSFQCGLVAYKWPKNTDFLISFLHPTTMKKKLYCVLKLLVMMQGKFWALFHFIFLKFLKPQNPDFWYVPDTITSYSIWKQHKIFILVQDKKNNSASKLICFVFGNNIKKQWGGWILYAPQQIWCLCIMETTPSSGQKEMAFLWWLLECCMYVLMWVLSFYRESRQKL